MLVFRLALRALRWRAAAAVTMFAVALVAVLAATVGPIYLHALDESVLATHLQRASQFQRDLLVSRTSVVGYGSVDWDAQVHTVATQVARSPFYGAPTTSTQLELGYGGPSPARGALATLPDECAHLHIVTGTCVSGPARNAAVISTRTAAAERLQVGDTLSASAYTNGVPVPLQVVGVYRPIAPDGPFWRPWDFFGAGDAASASAANGAPPPPTDAAFATPKALAVRVGKIQETFAANVPLHVTGIGYDDIGALHSTIARANALVARYQSRSSESGVPGADVTAPLPTILSTTSKETSLARTLVTVATAQLALLAILVLYAVVANTTTAQGPEVALAKLRGRRTRSVLVQSIAQPLVLVVLATPVAAVLAFLLVRLLAPHLLGHGADVVFPPAAYGVAAAAAAGGVLAAAVAARRIVVTPVGALLRRGADAPASRVGLLIADAAALTVAVAGLIELDVGGVLDGGSPNPLAVLAPTLLAIAVAIVVLRLLPFVGRRVASWTRDSRRLATFLAVRQLLRRPAQARALLLVAVALAIATFAVTNWTDAGHNRELRALNSAGADTVLVVRPGQDVTDLRTAVDRADPSGQSMAVEYSEADALPPLLAVDTSRFTRVAAWVRGNTTQNLHAVLHRLTADRRRPVTVRGSQLRLTIDLTTHPARPVQLAVSVAEPDREVAVRTIDPVRPHRSTYTVSLPSVCSQTCQLSGLAFFANTPYSILESPSPHLIQAVVGASVLTGGTWRPVADFGEAGRWRGDGRGQADARTSGAGLAVAVRQASGDAPWPTIVSTAAPAVLPVAVGSATAAQYVGNQIHDFDAVGLDGSTVSVDGVVRSVTLPRIDRRGVLVDFVTARAAMAEAPALSTQFQVWLSPTAPRDMRARLARRHVRVLRVIHASTYRSALDDSGSAYADSLFLVAALAATVLAIVAAAAGRVVSTRRRAYELAALEAVGVPPRVLRRATAAELGIVLALGVVVGLASGVVGSRLALPSTPVFVDNSVGPPLVFDQPYLLLGLLAVGLVVVFVVVSLLIAALVERAATPGQLRGAQQ